jgi:hypothetical protein
MQGNVGRTSVEADAEQEGRCVRVCVCVVCADKGREYKCGCKRKPEDAFEALLVLSITARGRIKPSNASVSLTSGDQVPHRE